MPFLTKLQIEPAGGPNWRLTAPLIYQIDGDAVITVPTGYISDGESTPWYMRGLIDEDSGRENAAWIHDFLYDKKPFSRIVCDRIFRMMLKELGTPAILLHRLYMGVRLFGWSHWK